MNKLKALGIFALALAMTAPAFAETQTVKVSGSLDVYWASRENFDLSDGNDVALVPVGNTTQGSSVGNNARGATSDSAQFWFSVVQVEIAADLTDNVSVVVNLFNQRDWNANLFDDNSGVGYSTSNATDEFDIGVDLAYVQMKEIFYAPLTLTIGRQDIEFGRGFIIGNWNIQDPNNGLTLDEYSAVTSYDAVVAALDFDPWTIHFASVFADQNSINSNDDRIVYIANVNYQFSEYNAEWEGYFMHDHQRVGDSTAASVPPTVNESVRTNTTYVVGTRAQYDPIEPLTLGGEVAYQFGQYFATTSTGVLVGTDGQQRDAWALDLFGEYRWSDHVYSPYVGLEYVFLSGDDPAADNNNSDHKGWNGLFRSPTYGVIYDYLETYYQTALVGDAAQSDNHQHLAINSGFMPMDDLSIDGTFYIFWTDEDVISTTGGNSGENVGTFAGNELDVQVTYDYTEDVTFGLGLAWFFPGDIYDDAHGGSYTNSLNDTATAVTASVGVTF